jgi:hypothetical protein
MALDTVPLPYGLREIKVTPFTSEAATAYAASSIKFPNARTMKFTESEEFEELRGDDRLVSVHGKGAQVEWEMEGGGFSFEAVRAMYGGTVTTTGISPNQAKDFNKSVLDVRPFFKSEGRSISDSGGDFHPTIYRCRATDKLEGEMADGAFWLTKVAGAGLPSLVSASLDLLYTLRQNETPVAIV